MGWKGRLALAAGAVVFVAAVGFLGYGIYTMQRELRGNRTQRQAKIKSLAYHIADKNHNLFVDGEEWEEMLRDMNLLKPGRVYSVADIIKVEPSPKHYDHYVKKKYPNADFSNP